VKPEEIWRKPTQVPVHPSWISHKRTQIESGSIMINQYLTACAMPQPQTNMTEKNK
jgi:hypothetical protein